LAASDAQAQLLNQLRDIHGAAEPGWWPPAPGWWLLSAILLVALLYAVRLLMRLIAVQRRRRAWMRALDAVDDRWDPDCQSNDYLAELNRLFRAVAIRAFPGTHCGRLQGEDWATFVRDRLPDGPQSACVSALAQGPYEPAPQFDAAALREQARFWVRHYG
jgi:hypothetical protein